MQTRIAGARHIGTHRVWKSHAALFELMRGDRARAAQNAFELARLARERDLPMFQAFGVFLRGLGGVAKRRARRRARGHAPRRRAAARTERSVFRRLLKIALAEAEARAGDPDRAVAILDEALATSDALAIARSTLNCIGRAAKFC